MTPVIDHLNEQSIFAALRYMLGMSETAPETALFGVDPTRLRGWWARWLSTHPQVTVTLRKPTPTGSALSATRTAAAAPPAKTAGSFMEQARDWANEHRLPLCAGMSAVASSNPELYQRHVDQIHTLAALRFEHDQLQAQLDVRQRVAAHNKH